MEKILGFKCLPNQKRIQTYHNFQKDKFKCFQDLSTIKDFSSKYSNKTLKRVKRFGVQGLSLVNFRHTLNDLTNRDLVEELKSKSPELMQIMLNQMKQKYDEFNLTVGNFP